MSLLLLAAFSSAAPPKDLVKAKLIASSPFTHPALGPLRVALELTIAPGWHIYWKNPGEGGLPTTATLELPTGWAATPFEFPIPKTFDLPGGLTAYGYEDHVTLVATITPTGWKPQGLVTCKANWMVCNDICVAGSATAAVDLQFVDNGFIAQPDPAIQRVFSEALGKLPTASWDTRDIGPVTSSVLLAAEGKSGRLEVRLPWRPFAPQAVEFFPPPTDGLIFAKPVVAVSDHVTTINVPFDVLVGQQLPAGPVGSVLSWKQDSQIVGVKVPVHFELATPSAK